LRHQRPDRGHRRGGGLLHFGLPAAAGPAPGPRPEALDGPLPGLIFQRERSRVQRTRDLRLSINPKEPDNGKEGCARETQEGCPALFKSYSFKTFIKVLKLYAACRKDLFDKLRSRIQRTR